MEEKSVGSTAIPMNPISILTESIRNGPEFMPGDLVEYTLAVEYEIAPRTNLKATRIEIHFGIIVQPGSGWSEDSPILNSMEIIQSITEGTNGSMLRLVPTNDLRVLHRLNKGDRYDLHGLDEIQIVSELKWTDIQRRPLEAIADPYVWICWNRESTVSSISLQELYKNDMLDPWNWNL